MEKVKHRKSLLTHWPSYSYSVWSISHMPKSVSHNHIQLSNSGNLKSYFCFAVLSTLMKQGEDKTSRMYYASSALTYLLAMVCSNMALQWVNYPTQVSYIVKKYV